MSPGPGLGTHATYSNILKRTQTYSNVLQRTPTYSNPLLEAPWPGHPATDVLRRRTRHVVSPRPCRQFIAHCSQFVTIMMNTVMSPAVRKPVAFLPTKRGGARARTSRARISGRPTSKARVGTVLRSTEGEGEAAVETVAAKDVCKTCGVPLSEIPFGCDQSGRIQGGIGAVPGTFG